MSMALRAEVWGFDVAKVPVTPPAVRVQQERRLTDISKIVFTAPSVAAIILWVISLAGAWYTVDQKLDSVQSDVRNLGTQMEGQGKLIGAEQEQRDARVKEVELTIKAHEIRIRQLENELATLRRR